MYNMIYLIYLITFVLLICNTESAGKKSSFYYRYAVETSIHGFDKFIFGYPVYGNLDNLSLYY